MDRESSAGGRGSCCVRGASGAGVGLRLFFFERGGDSDDARERILGASGGVRVFSELASPDSRRILAGRLRAGLLELCANVYEGPSLLVYVPRHKCVDLRELADLLVGGDVEVLCALAYGLSVAPGLVWALCGAEERNAASILEFYENFEGHTMGVPGVRSCTHPIEFVSSFLLLVRGCAVR